MKPSSPVPSSPPTDWGRIAEWYDQLVGESGSEYHRHVVLPGTMRLLGPVSGQRIVDVACGQGVLCQILAKAGAQVTGVDAARELIDMARQRSDDQVSYQVGDARKLGFLAAESFHAATCILAIQNIHPIGDVFSGVAQRLRPGGRFVVVMMHPCFRGSKQTHWGWNADGSIQYRRVDRYLLPRKEPIVANPGRKDGVYTWSFHRPLSDYIKAARKAGLLVDAIEEWPSHKSSEPGPRAAAENRARQEIPMFLALRAIKCAAAEAPTATGE